MYQQIFTVQRKNAKCKMHSGMILCRSVVRCGDIAISYSCQLQITVVVLRANL